MIDCRNKCVFSLRRNIFSDGAVVMFSVQVPLKMMMLMIVTLTYSSFRSHLTFHVTLFSGRTSFILSSATVYVNDVRMQQGEEG